MAFAVALPVETHLHSRFVWLVMLLLSATAGCVMVTLAVAVQPFASVTVTVRMPMGRLFAVAVVCTGALFHE